MSAGVFFQARNSGQICAFKDLLRCGLWTWEQLSVAALEVHVRRAAGKQTEEWFHVATEKEVCFRMMWNVWLVASAHMVDLHIQPCRKTSWCMLLRGVLALVAWFVCFCHWRLMNDAFWCCVYIKILLCQRDNFVYNRDHMTCCCLCVSYSCGHPDETGVFSEEILDGKPTGTNA